MARRRIHFATAFLVVVLALLPAAGYLQYRVIQGSASALAARLQRSASTAVRQIRNELAFTYAGIIAMFHGATEPEILTESWPSLARNPELIRGVRLLPELPEEQVYGTVYVRAGDGRVFAVETDQDYLAGTLMPQLIREYLPPDETGFEAAVYDWTSGSVAFATTDVAAEDFDLDHVVAPPGAPATDVRRALRVPRRIVPDESMPLTAIPFDARFAVDPGSDSAGGSSARAFVEQWAALRESLLGRPEVVPFLRPRASETGLELLIWHASGGIIAAERREIVGSSLLSACVLGLLAALAVVFYVLYRRSRRQAEREREFVATITHELRTPLAAMYSASENLSQGVVTDPGRVRIYGEALLVEGRRLRTMIDQTLRYAGLNGNRDLPRDRVNLVDILDELRTRPFVDPDRISVDVPLDTPTILGDADALAALVGNIVDNAFLHNPSGTTVTVELARRTLKGRQGAIIEISDNGTGIARPDLPHVTEPFFRGTGSRARQTPGTGLGLSIADRIARRHGGTLRVASEGEGEEGGTTVTVFLPAEIDE